jgi:hypothetical protein
MSTYELLLKPPFPLLLIRKLPDRDVGLYGSLDSGCVFKKFVHLWGIEKKFGSEGYV